MAIPRTDMLAAVKLSLVAAGARDRAGWVGLFTPDARIEDPVGSQPHRGTDAIVRFYDTFIGPREITNQPDVDIVVGSTVIRDLTLEVKMASTLTMPIPASLRYDVRQDNGELKIAALYAFWELPAMMGQFLRSGVRAGPAGAALAKTMLSNQGFAGTLGFLSGFRGIGTGGKGLFTRFLDDACAGDEIGMRRRLAGQANISSGDDLSLSAADLLKHLSGARWTKLIGSGYAVVATTERAGRRSVLIGDIGSDPVAIKRIRLFTETE